MTNGAESGWDSPALAALSHAFELGNIAEVRTQLTRLDDAEREILRLELGDEQYEQVYRLVRRAQRGAKMGHVVVLHGIMGGTLSVRRKSDTDRVWMNFWRLARGRMADLELDAQGLPVNPGVQVRVTGQIKRYYLPMVLQLEQQWNVLPFAYDWREDISISARRLAEAVTRFTQGKPAHLVAHSMGGLVSRYMILKHAETWHSMADGDCLAAGGRLVMLGTPNHGSFAIPIAMTGEDRMVRLLAGLDVKHRLESLLRITNSFPGSYQMLPSALVDLGDDHRKLFQARHWGNHKVNPELLKRGKQFHEELEDVVDQDRFLYIAGHGKSTPHRIKVEAQGRFSYRYTPNGDGRVPHDLGLLDGVTTYWTGVEHGDLARDADILDAMDGLLETGRTDVFPSIRPSIRGTVDERWQNAAEHEALDSEIEALLNKETRNPAARKSRLSREEQVRIEASLLADYLGTTRGKADMPKPRSDSDKGGRPPSLRIEVVWGDITKCEADVYAVGHYQGVLPQVAELALDAAISNDPDRLHLDRHVLRQHTLRGTLRGALGDVDFFPWIQKKGLTRTVAVAGMGRIGSFTPGAMRTLSRALTLAIAGIQGVETACTVLIGSGEGTLTVEESLAGLSMGLADVLGSEEGRPAAQVKCVKIVEIFRDRAQDILDTLLAHKEYFGQNLHLEIAPKLIRGENAHIRPEDALGLMLERLLMASKGERGESRRNSYEDILHRTALGSRIRKSELREVLEHATRFRTGPANQARFFVSQRPESGNNRVPFRLSYLTEGDDIRAAAISDTATVSERVLKFDQGLVEQVSAEVMDVRAPLRESTPGFLRKLVLPKEFHELIDRGESFVFEVDRHMAQIPWEVIASGGEAGQHQLPLAINAQVARQMRTTYSASPSVGGIGDGTVRALVIGDPGDPEKRHNLPGAEREAIQVADLLRHKNAQVDLLVGAPNSDRTGRLRGIPAATRVRVMEKLMLEEYHILHYCGHGTFDEEKTERAGWLFSDGMLTAYELERISDIPRLVVANACLTGRASQRAAGMDRISRLRHEAALLPSLADEFFHQGVNNYVGTAWEVSDLGAILFALTFYETLFPDAGEQGGNGVTIGDAVSKARKAVWDKRGVYGKLWAAYQHYGDPTSPL